MLLPNYQNSKGTLEELRVAHQQGIRVFGPTEWEGLVQWWKAGAYVPSILDRPTVPRDTEGDVREVFRECESED